MIEEGNFSWVEILVVYTRKDGGVERGEAHWNNSQSSLLSCRDHTATKCSKSVGMGIKSGYTVPLMVQRLMLQSQSSYCVSPHLQLKEMLNDVVNLLDTCIFQDNSSI